MRVELATTRIEYADEKIDAYGRRTFTLYWMTDYTPSKPYPHERAQVFFANPAQYIGVACKHGRLERAQLDLFEVTA